MLIPVSLSERKEVKAVSELTEDRGSFAWDWSVEDGFMGSVAVLELSDAEDTVEVSLDEVLLLGDSLPLVEGIFGVLLDAGLLLEDGVLFFTIFTVTTFSGL